MALERSLYFLKLFYVTRRPLHNVFKLGSVFVANQMNFRKTSNFIMLKLLMRFIRVMPALSSTMRKLAKNPSDVLEAKNLLRIVAHLELDPNNTNYIVENLKNDQSALYSMRERAGARFRFLLPQLGKMEPGTVGKCLYLGVTKNGIDLNEYFEIMLSEIKKADPVNVEISEDHWVALRSYQIHDFIHTITGVPPTPFGELYLVWFISANNKNRNTIITGALVSLRLIFSFPRSILSTIALISKARKDGAKMRNVLGIRFEDLLKEDITQVRADLGIPPHGLVHNTKLFPPSDMKYYSFEEFALTN
jgi:ubiquinone biosynthesis protein Coq4